MDGGQQLWQGGLCLSEVQEDVNAAAILLTLHLVGDFAPRQTVRHAHLHGYWLTADACSSGRDVNTLQKYVGQA